MKGRWFTPRHVSSRRTQSSSHMISDRVKGTPGLSIILITQVRMQWGDLEFKPPKGFFHRGTV